MNGNTILITGAAGFIGARLALSLFQNFEKIKVIGIDNMNLYYDISLKKYRIKLIQDELKNNDSNYWRFIKADISDKSVIEKIFKEEKPDIVVNLAAQAGVRYSIENPDAYIDSNIIGFYNILEACKHSYDGGNSGVKHLVYASSSSVYGSNKKIPYSTEDKVDNPISLYAATKKSNELFAHAYSKIYNIPSTGLRFFTVYGPAGRPDMAYFKFTNTLIKNGIINIFNYGNCERDFTYIDDIIEGIIKVMKTPPKRGLGKDGLPIAPYALFNIGNSKPENLIYFVKTLCDELMRVDLLPKEFKLEQHCKLVPMQPGDVPITYADTNPLERKFSFKPSTPLKIGLRKFVEWYKEYYSRNLNK